MHRAVHQTLEGGTIFADPYALQILDDEARANLPAMAADPAHRPMRLFIAARSRFSEEAMATCVARGVRQVVILGAGLDTFALRNPHAGITVYEIDYPATQAWKRERLTQTGVALPPSLTFAPIDFERQSLGKGLSASGFRADEPAFFQWLGVTPYLTREAIVSTLDFVASIAGSESYSSTRSRLRTTRRPCAPILSQLPKALPHAANLGSACLILLTWPH
ncbi:class I SAM-dependent methyltransferase [Bradyrhizobium sp.]|uniref:class I SAM-dependent methyltransferase n=1 Tax=Bradyrhizobium sp. TaxID=376 RepID=UPI00341F1FCF